LATVITTIYEDGVFKPLRKVNLKNHQRMQITINSQVSVEPSFVVFLWWNLQNGRAGR